MTLVFTGICSHGPGITGRAELAPPDLKDGLYQAFDGMREALRASRPDALIIIAAEHFANFFMNNMPCYAMGMAESYAGPIEDAEWLRVPRRTARGDADLSRRLTKLFLRDANGRRPTYGETSMFQEDPHWRDLVLFHEYFHGDNGVGLGASHQTGWTGLVAKLIQQSGGRD